MSEPTSEAFSQIKSELARLSSRIEALTENQIVGQSASLLDARLAAIVESSEDAIIGKDLDGVITSWNLGAVRIFGYTAGEVIGKSILILLPPDRVEEEAAILKRLRAGDRLEHFQTVRMNKSGHLIDVSLTISPIRDARGVVIGASKIARDISEEKKIIAELQAAKEAAESANRAKDDFLAILSHELRTPLTPVLAAVDLFEQSPHFPADLRQELQAMRRNIQMEARLISDLLDLTRVNRGMIECHPETTDMHALVTSVLTMYHADIVTKKLVLTMSLEAHGFQVWADPRRIQQVIWNLVSNAIKFSPEGAALTVRSFNPNKDAFALEVRDTGIGIAAEWLERIFLPFEQGDPEVPRAFGGLGLGLALAKSIAEMHHGNLHAASAGLGKGSSFTLTLPLMVEGDPVRPAIKPEHSVATASKKFRILLVEDNRDTLRLIALVLHRAGHKVQTADTMKEAMELLNSQTFDLIVSDIGLPDGDGWELMRYAKQRSAIRGIAMSGYGSFEDLDRSRQAGFSQHITKPVDVSELQSAIGRIAG